MSILQLRHMLTQFEIPNVVSFKVVLSFQAFFVFRFFDGIVWYLLLFGLNFRSIARTSYNDRSESILLRFVHETQTHGVNFSANTTIGTSVGKWRPRDVCK